jgi:hypothetical protein
MKHWVPVVALSVLASCSRNDSDDGFAPTPTTPLLPVAVAGDDFEVLTGSAVTLNGSKSYDPAGGAPGVLWTQVVLPGQPTLVLTEAPPANATFTAPATPMTLRFQVTVTGSNGTDLDTVDVRVLAMRVTAPDTWFVGYGRGDAGPADEASVVATVSGGTGPYTFEWSGLEAWFDATTPATETVAGPSHALKGITPRLKDFQNFPDRAEVAILEKTTQGRLQLKVKVTDSSVPPLTDEELVNFSAGPFSDAVANENAALGEPVFLNGAATNAGGAITAWGWSMNAAPVGSTAAFRKPDKSALGADPGQRFVYFVPDKVGEYRILLTQTSTGSPQVKVITVIAGKYVGVGNLTGKTPDPFKGECASCHAGQLGWLADFANPWKETGHARMFERLLDPADPLHGPARAKDTWNDLFNFGSSYSIDSRTVGWSRLNPPASALASGGWAHQAEADGYVFHDSTWPELVRKHPRLAGLSNVQCESCHGPGSEHAGDSQFIRKSYDASVCGRCHSRKQDLWEASAHGTPLPASPTFGASGSASCNNCHTAQGYIVDLRAQEGADPHDVLFAFANLNRPVVPADERRGVTCQACHEPHKKTANRPASAMDPQLRSFGNVRFRNGAVVNAGEAAVCFTCHQSRTDTSNTNGDMDIRRAPHDSTAAEMLTGQNAVQFFGWTYASSPHGIAGRFVTPSRGENRQCLACHADVQPAKGAPGYNALGGHTFHVKQGTGAAVAGDGTHGAVTLDPAAKTLLVHPATSGPGFLKRVFTGDAVLLDGVPNTVANVDGARQVTLASAPPGAVTAWTITSTVKYNTAACTQCHTVGTTFDVTARGDYDGDGVTETIQNEIAGLRAALLGAIEAEISALVGTPSTLMVDRGRIKYRRTSDGVVRTFPGPAVSQSDNPEFYPWSGVAEPGRWSAVYGAAYNYVFEGNDKSRGIHNTGYAINLLQSSYKAVTGATIGAPFAPF